MAEACAWVGRIESGELTHEDRAELRRWTARSPQHAAALRFYAELWLRGDSLVVLRPYLKEARDDDRSLRRSFRIPALAFGATLLLAVATAFWQLAPTVGEDRLRVRTDIGETRHLTLSDGTVLSINTASDVEVGYTRSERLVRLSRGEAVFSVARDADRPFLVHADGKVVRAIGTEFAVRLEDGAVAVSVTEGRVELSTGRETAASGQQKEARTRPIAVLIEGQQASLAPSGEHAIWSVDRRTLDRRLSWRNGFVDFSGETLDYAVREIMRYTPYRVEIADSHLGSISVGGVFEIGDAEHLFAVLEESFHVRVETIEPGLIRLSSMEVADE